MALAMSAGCDVMNWGESGIVEGTYIDFKHACQRDQYAAWHADLSGYSADVMYSHLQGLYRFLYDLCRSPT